IRFGGRLLAILSGSLLIEAKSEVLQRLLSCFDVEPEAMRSVSMPRAPPSPGGIWFDKVRESDAKPDVLLAQILQHFLGPGKTMHVHFPCLAVTIRMDGGL